ncbi:hypothetical protein SLEP1_g20431 [Rubroshorea leprosula]|uniref:Uncharacterized protein n=1 Tax=Rubroshorea leprosula TaxID=152421 RepID=A0AAV5J2P5_9ROSI|nr:hypothetical protein SLEP1_g20431 [Rubroshorea leprosula]
MGVIQVTKVTPSSHSPKSASDFSLPLTFLDIFWFKFPPVERLFFYRLPDINHNFFNSEVLPKLKTSLSLTLLHFLPLAGNLTWPSPDAAKPFIRYTPNDGVSFTVAESNEDFDRLSGSQTYEANESHHLVPPLKVSDDTASIIALQVTLFLNKGFCIGITTHHTVLDGKSTAMFVKAWAHTCRQGEKGNSSSSLPIEYTPFFDRSVIKDPSGLDILYLNQWLAFTASSDSRSLKVPQNLGVVPHDLVRATFQLTRENIKILREMVVSKWDKSKPPIHLSTFVLTLAYTTTCMVKARGGETDRNIVWGFAADYRSRLDPPVPENYFGNCVGPRWQAVRARDFMDENGLNFAVEKLTDEIKDLEKGQVLEGAENKMSSVLDLVKESTGSVQLIGVAGSPRFNVYESNFGWGKPEKVEIVSIDRTGAISLAESADGSGGVEIGLALMKHEMEIFASFFIHGCS